jgi:hypothetical protein
MRSLLIALKLAESLKLRFPAARFYLDLRGASSQPNRQI